MNEGGLPAWSLPSQPPEKKIHAKVNVCQPSQLEGDILKSGGESVNIAGYLVRERVGAEVEKSELEFAPVWDHVHDAADLHQEQACWILQGRSNRTSCENIIDCSKDSYITWC